jgi:hypothetical protein
MKGRHDARCSFCGKNRKQVKQLVAGPGVYICDRCVELCHEVIEQESRRPPMPESTTRRGGWVGRVIRLLPRGRLSRLAPSTTETT